MPENVMQLEIPKVYTPESIEPRWARIWVERQLYRPRADASRPTYCLVIAPPNITGSLHMGHMLEHTEVDVLMRWRRMSGDDVLWLPGTDHASIATQMIVERELGREALPELEPGPRANSAWQREGQRLRLAMGREKFIERCWKWREANGGTIKRQMERLGASCDWSRERFTMDAAYSRSVIEAFVRLHREGLIYRDRYVVSWCPRCRTALSDLEVIHEERKGKLWFIRYPFEGSQDFVTVATTRPETMLGDAAVALNPQDPKAGRLVGRKLRLPLVDRVIPVIADDFVDPKFGTGAVKITPAHDPNDFAMALRHPTLGWSSVIAPDARIEAADESLGRYRNMDRYEARKAILSDLANQGLLEGERDHALSVGTCQRCKTDIEYLPSMQWFMKMKPLTEPAIEAVRAGRIKIVPENGIKKYLNWMENIHDWCISRQLWWGHRIPAWTCAACDEMVVASERPGTCPKCGTLELRSEEDVLDTWFSSALWPFATLGWPEPSDDLRRFYPNDLMVMGEDILFFWGARMIMMGLKLTGDVPFRELYVHALVRDAERQKMSKTKGNVLDPLEVTEKYGTDAVRFALAASAAPGTDIAFSKDKIESYRAFANKVWNAGRFVLLNAHRLPEAVREQLAVMIQPVAELGYSLVVSSERGNVPASAGEPRPALIDRWIFSRLASVTRETDEALKAFRFHEAAHVVYHFFWHEFCDWYLEWIKPAISSTPLETRPSVHWINLMRVFAAALHLLHPFMPFVTEELANQLPGASGDSLSLQPFELVRSEALDPVSEKQFETIRELVVAVRNAKAERNIHTQKPSAQVASEDGRLLDLLREHQEAILRLAGLEGLNFTRARLAASVERIPVSSSVDLRLFYDSQQDVAAERERLLKEKRKLEQSMTQLQDQLHDEQFLSRAPGEIVRSAERRHQELSAEHRKVVERLEHLNG